MLNSSPRLIGFEFFIDCKSGETGKQNISQQTFVPTAVSSKVMNVSVYCVKLTVAKMKKKNWLKRSVIYCSHLESTKMLPSSAALRVNYNITIPVFVICSTCFYHHLEQLPKQMVMKYLISLQY